ncbi:MAG: DUF1285 domain-containing protein, partial [Pseudomonadota bacterium]
MAGRKDEDAPVGASREAKANGAAGGDLDALAQSAGAAAHASGRRAPPPVHLWDPPFCGDLDIRIRRDGSWTYLGSPIRREALVRLFGGILRREEDGRHYLVTPVEKIGIEVEDAAFIGVDVEAAGDGAAQRVEILTNHDDRVTLGPDHALRHRRARR